MQTRSTAVREIPGGLVPVPAVATDLTTSDSFVQQIFVSNPTAAPITFTLKDKQTPARNIIPGIVIPANSLAPDNWFWDVPVKAIGGLNWVASAVGLEAEVWGYVKGA